MMTARKVIQELKLHINPEKAAFFPRFFKTGKGEYGEGDKFLGVIVPDQRKTARKFKDLPETEIIKLLDNQYHQCRLTAVFIMVLQFEKAKSDDRRKQIYDLYFKKMDRINAILT